MTAICSRCRCCTAHTKSRAASLFVLGVAILALSVTVAPTATAADPIRVRSGNRWAIETIRDIAQTAQLLPTDWSLDRWADQKNIQRFCDRECDILVHVARGLLPSEEANLLRAGKEGSEPVSPEVVGQIRVAVIVHPSNPVKAVSVRQLRGLLSSGGQDMQWAALGGRPGRVACYGEKSHVISRQLIRELVLVRHAGGYHQIRDDFTECSDGGAVIEAVRADRNGMGVLLYTGGRLAGVKTISVAQCADPVELKTGEFIQAAYPLSQTITLLGSPAKRMAWDTLVHAVRNNRKLIAGKGIVTPTCHTESMAYLRLEQMKVGKGTRLPMLGAGDARSPFQDLTTEYVRAKAVIQSSYAAVNADVSAIGAFVNGKGASVRELLVLADKPSGRAMELHGEKWNSLGVDKDGKPNGTGPAEYVIAGRAAAVIVNPANKLNSLTLAQIESIFGGDVKDWSLIGGTGLSSPDGPAGRDGAIPIQCFGLFGRDPAGKLFRDECLPSREFGRVNQLKDTAAVLSAVSTEPGAIGFVDLAAIPAAGQSAKVLAIQIGTGSNAKIIQPTPENIRTAMYPISRRTYLYVHPKASETAKDFAKFIATCGASEATPYADTVKAMMDTYAKHGLIPLADAAVERMARDAQEAQARVEAARKK